MDSNETGIVRRNEKANLVLAWVLGVVIVAFGLAVSYVTDWSQPAGVMLLVWTAGIGPGSYGIWWLMRRSKGTEPQYSSYSALDALRAGSIWFAYVGLILFVIIPMTLIFGDRAKEI